MTCALPTCLNTVQQKGGIRARGVAQLLNVTPETVSCWRTGDAEPPPGRRDYLLRLKRLVSEPGDLYPLEETRLWRFSPHRLLGGDRPADKIQQGKIEDITAMIVRINDGAYV